MIINKETMIEAIRELGHVTLTEVEDMILVRSEDLEVTVVIKPVYTGTTITRVECEAHILSYYEIDHDEREYKTLNGLINYITRHIAMLPSEIYSCKNDRVAKNRFKELIQYDIKDNGLDYYNHNDTILVSTDLCEHSIYITVVNGQFNAEVKTYRGGNTLEINNERTFVNLQSLLHIKGVI